MMIARPETALPLLFQRLIFIRYKRPAQSLDIRFTHFDHIPL